MKKTYLIGGGITLIAAAILVGCNSNDDEGGGRGGAATTTVTVTPSLGKILNAKVILRNARTGVQLGTGNTGNTGSAKLTVPVTSVPVVVEVQSTGATYFDESKKAEVSLDAEVDAGSTFHAVLPALNAATNVGVTTLTDIAYKMAVKKAVDENKLGAELVNEANQKVGEALAPELIAAGQSILLAPKAVGSAADFANLDNTPASLYALRLAALVNLAGGEDSSPALTVLEVLSDDLVNDGKLNGNRGSDGAPTIPTSLYTLADLNAKINAQLVALQADFAKNVTVNLANTFVLHPEKFNITLINVGVTIGGGTGTGCVVSISSAQLPGGFKVCYKNFPQNTICGANNAALNAAAQAYASAGASLSFSQGSCVGANVTVDFSLINGAIQ